MLQILCVCVCWAIERWLLSNIRFFFFFFLYDIIHPSERVVWVYSEDETNFVYMHIIICIRCALNFSRESVFLSWLIILTYYYCCCCCRRRHRTSHLTLSVLMNRENTHERERKRERRKKRKSMCHPIRYIHGSCKNINERFYSNKEKSC